jgi:RimJ/RimL family protein N-acetyltransferase
MKIIETTRLTLRSWEEDDARNYFQINQDPEVTKFLPRTITLEESKKFIASQNQQLKERGYCLFACELKDTKELIGFVGLNYTNWQETLTNKNYAALPAFVPTVEIGWRLASKFWQKGYASEAAKAILNHFLSKNDLNEILSFTVSANARSISVMEKIGMKRDFSGDFFHPKLPLDHQLSKHVLYRISAKDFKKS